MNARLRRLAAAFALLLGADHAGAAAGLDVSNFVDVGDTVTELLDTSALAWSTMMLDAGAASTERARLATFRPPKPTAHAQTTHATCPGGGKVHTTIFDADADGELSAGDRFVTVFEACAIGGGSISGRSEFVVAAHRFEGSVELTELAFAFDDLGTVQMRWTGAARAALRSDLQRGTERYVVTYLDLAVARGAQRMRWSFALDVVRPPFGNALATLDGAMRVGELRLGLRQDEPFELAGDGHPRAGRLTLSDERGAQLLVEAGRRRYTYRLYRAGSERPEAVSQSKRYGEH
jgi:hypothetical protein